MLSFFKSFSSNVHSKYDVSRRESFRVGPWTVYKAKSRATEERVSVFILDKKELTEALAGAGIKSKSAVTAEIYDFAKRGAAQLAKLRHPSIVRLIEPLEQAGGALIFVTERLHTNLGHLIRVKGTQSSSDDERDELDELTIERGLSLIIQGLQFLHDQLGYVHLNLSPSSILVDASGDWKLSGLEFLESYREHTGSYFLPQLDPRLPPYIHPSIDYLAPELVLDHKLSPENDVFALGLVVYAVYLAKNGLNTRNNPNSYKEEYNKFQQKLNTIKPLGRMSSQLLLRLLDRNPASRIELAEFSQSDYFNNSLVKALLFLDDFSPKPANEKVRFLKYLIGVLDQFPRSVKQRKLLKFAIQELKGPRDPSTGELLGNLLFSILRDMKVPVSVELLRLFSELGDFEQFQESLVANMDVISKGNTSSDNFTTYVLPVVLNILKVAENARTVLQRELLSKTSEFVSNLTISGLEQKLFPSILELFAATPAKSVKIACIQSFAVLMDKGLSKSLVQDKLMPALEKMKTRDAAVVMAAKNLYEAVAAKASSAMIMEKVIPHLGDLSMSPNLTVPQFKSIFALIRRELDKVEHAQVDSLKHNKDAAAEFDTGFSAQNGQTKSATDFFDDIPGSSGASPAVIVSAPPKKQERMPWDPPEDPKKSQSTVQALPAPSQTKNSRVYQSGPDLFDPLGSSSTTLSGPKSPSQWTMSSTPLSSQSRPGALGTLQPASATTPAAGLGFPSLVAQKQNHGQAPTFGMTPLIPDKHSQAQTLNSQSFGLGLTPQKPAGAPAPVSSVGQSWQPLQPNSMMAQKPPKLEDEFGDFSSNQDGSLL